MRFYRPRNRFIITYIPIYRFEPRDCEAIFYTFSWHTNKKRERESNGGDWKGFEMEGKEPFFSLDDGDFPKEKEKRKMVLQHFELH